MQTGQKTLDKKYKRAFECFMKSGPTTSARIRSLYKGFGANAVRTVGGGLVMAFYEE